MPTGYGATRHDVDHSNALLSIGTVRISTAATATLTPTSSGTSAAVPRSSDPARRQELRNGGRQPDINDELAPDWILEIEAILNDNVHPARAGQDRSHVPSVGAPGLNAHPGGLVFAPPVTNNTPSIWSMGEALDDRYHPYHSQGQDLAYDEDANVGSPREFSDAVKS